MDEKERAEKDIKKLEAIIHEFKSYKFKKYDEVLEWAVNYFHDSKHFFDKGDYFSAFGAANYAYGIIDGLLILEKKKGDEC
ncbi:MAG: DUF357 domain-containing protein [Candidatus Micrarchaeota archaeon]